MPTNANSNFIVTNSNLNFTVTNSNSNFTVTRFETSEFSTLREYETSEFTTISEIFVINTAFAAFVLNLVLVVCGWKVSTLTSGLKLFFVNFGVAGCFAAFGSFSVQIVNVIVRIFDVGPVTERLCSGFRIFFAVPINVMAYQLMAIAVDRLIVLFKLKRQQKVGGSGFYYCSNSNLSNDFDSFEDRFGMLTG